MLSAVRIADIGCRNCKVQPWHFLSCWKHFPVCFYEIDVLPQWCWLRSGAVRYSSHVLPAVVSPVFLTVGQGNRMSCEAVATGSASTVLLFIYSLCGVNMVALHGSCRKLCLDVAQFLYRFKPYPEMMIVFATRLNCCEWERMMWSMMKKLAKQNVQTLKLKNEEWKRFMWKDDKFWEHACSHAHKHTFWQACTHAQAHTSMYMRNLDNFKDTHI